MILIIKSKRTSISPIVCLFQLSSHEGGEITHQTITLIIQNNLLFGGGEKRGHCLLLWNWMTRASEG